MATVQVTTNEGKKINVELDYMKNVVRKNLDSFWYILKKEYPNMILLSYSYMSKGQLITLDYSE